MSAWWNAKTLDARLDLWNPELCETKTIERSASIADSCFIRIESRASFAVTHAPHCTSTRRLVSVGRKIQTTKAHLRCRTISTRSDGGSATRKRHLLTMCSRPQSGLAKSSAGIAKFAEARKQTGTTMTIQSRFKFAGFAENTTRSSEPNPAALTTFPKHEQTTTRSQQPPWRHNQLLGANPTLAGKNQSVS